MIRAFLLSPHEWRYRWKILFSNGAYCFHVRSGLFQGPFHFVDRDPRGIIIDCVYLSKVTKAFLDLAHTLQPLQGRFPDVVSPDDKNDFRFIAGILSGAREREDER